eukprot:TRINITY_DN66319_c0_g1_i1.p2 TRINITY_DN66319_c0_g1~~TRINITY_DN66319_c0_g1_i1.p2  ORF type:complete len:123 (-),score=37.21 TRINITY_DN66319_c0_g1_i1:106-474(-)
MVTKFQLPVNGFRFALPGAATLQRSTKQKLEKLGIVRRQVAEPSQIEEEEHQEKDAEGRGRSKEAEAEGKSSRSTSMWWKELLAAVDEGSESSAERSQPCTMFLKGFADEAARKSCMSCVAL